jgi:tetratricopeptide (TPR) repeat protein
MSRRHGLLFAAALLSALTGASAPLRAGDPDVWEVAASPRLARDTAALREAQRLMLAAQGAGARATTERALLSAALRALEQADAPRSPDPRVRMFLGRVLAARGESARAVEVLEPALATAPWHPAATEAFAALALAYARLGRPRDEIGAYEAVLARQTMPEARAAALCNQAEAYMSAGEIEEAVARYEASARLDFDNPLPHWGLAVALDRGGDHEAALQEAGVALRYDPDAAELSGPRVFFVPAHERFWYQAIGAMARARSEKDRAIAALWWRRAALLWTQYLDAAAPSERWVLAARARRAWSERAEKAAVRGPVKPPSVSRSSN